MYSPRSARKRAPSRPPTPRLSGGLVIETYGPRASFLCVSAAAAVACVGYLFLPETKKAYDSESAKGAEDETAEPPGFLVLLQEREWRGVALAEGCARVGYAAKLASVPVLASEVLPGGATSAGALLSAAGLSGLVGAPLGGFITDRIGGWFQVDVFPA